MGVHPRRFVTISGYGESRESVADACVIAYCRKYGFDAQFREFTRISTPDGYIYADRPKARLKIRTMTKSTQELLAVRQ
jgi:hypothetical protein